MKTLELKYLACYLPYGLQIKAGNSIETLSALQHNSPFTVTRSIKDSRKGEWRNLEAIKPILHPLSDLTKEIDHNGEKFVPLNKIEQLFTVEITSEGNGNFEMASILLGALELPYCIVQKLFEWHFWIFDQSYFDEGIIINKNTLEKSLTI